MHHQAHSYAPRSLNTNAVHTPAFVTLAVLAADAFAILAAAVASAAVYHVLSDIPVDRSVYLSTALLLAVFFTVLIRSRGGYEAAALLDLGQQVKMAVSAWFMSFGLILGCVFMLKTSADLSRGAALVYAVLGVVTVVAQRLVMHVVLRNALARGAVRRRRAIVLTAGSAPLPSAKPDSLKQAGINVVRSFHLPDDAVARAHMLSWVVSTSRRAGVDEILVVLSSAELEQLERIMEGLRAVAIPIRLMPEGVLSRLALQPSRSVGSLSFIDIAREPLTTNELRAKRVLDILVAGSALLAAAPLMVLAMIAIKLDSPGSVLFRQNRRGFNGRTFRILKLRTMSVMENGPVTQATKHDPRVTRVGAWLRRTSIDELPQLWNVLRGEMSVVGPRPHAVAHDNYYDQLIENYAFRHHVKPGLTGWAQVSGHRGETPQVEMMAARVKHDVWYINNWTFLLDLKILLLTSTRLLARSAY